MRRIRGIVTARTFWILVAIMTAMTLIHYLTPQLRPLFPALGAMLRRQAVGRIIFVLPVAGATFVFGRTGGIVTLVVTITILLPRAIWLSTYPADAVMETVATGTVGYLVLWMIETEEREKSLRREAVARMRSFNAMCSIVAKSLELEQILNEALDKALEVTNLEVGWMCSLDRQTGELHLCVHRNLTEDSIRGLRRFQLGEGLCGRVAQSRQPMVMESLSQDPGLGDPRVQREGFRSLVIVPLTSKGKVQGVMSLGSKEQREFPSADLQLITTFGKQIGVGVENAQLHRDVEKQLHIQQRLNEVAEKITSELELDKILPKVLQIAEELTEADCGFIALFDPGTKRLSYPYLHNLPQGLASVTVSQGEGVAGETMSTMRAVTIPDYRTYANAVPAFLDAGLVSVAAVPIVSGNRSFGTLAVGSLQDARNFSTAEVSTLAGVGRQAGIAIDNARLYENMRYYARQITRAQEDERKRIAREAHDETTQILVALSRRLDALMTSPERPDDAFKGHLGRVRELATDALQSVRRFSQDLRPPVLDDLGFVAAIRGLTRNLEEAGVKTELRVSGSPYRLSAEEDLVLFRIAQESLNNVRRHADASRAKVLVSFGHDRVQMVVEDDGRGFDAPSSFVDLVASGKLGLIGMHERARILGGTLRIESEPGEGTRLVVDAPVHRRG
jgi:signal transduction histidine kinase